MSTPHYFSHLLSDADRKLFACSKADGHCLHHMLVLPLHSSNCIARWLCAIVGIRMIYLEWTVILLLLCVLCIIRNQYYCSRKRALSGGGCTLEPPDEYDRAIHARRRCGLVSDCFDVMAQRNCASMHSASIPCVLPKRTPSYFLK